MLKRIFALLLVVVLVALAVAAYYLRDPNQFKQDLQDLAAEQSGYTATINGDIHSVSYTHLTLPTTIEV